MDSPLFSFPAILAQQSAPPSYGLTQLLIPLLFIVAMWFLIIAPQRKRQKVHAAMLASLKSGDQVITNGGIYGSVTSVKDDRLVIRIAENTKIELSKNFVSSKVDDSKK